jgi:hypothetical protein
MNRNKRSRHLVKLRKRIDIRQRLRILARREVWLASVVLAALTGGVLFMQQLSQPGQAVAATAGDYRTAASGLWGSPLTWETYDGSNWIPAVAAPTSANGVITLQAGHTVTVAAAYTVDQVTVNAGAVLTISTGSLTINNGTGSDLDVSGTANLNPGGTLTINSGAVLTIQNGGTWNTNGGTQSTTGWVVSNGGTYVHNVDGVTIPTATWGPSSTLKITGVVSSNITGTYQDFGNLVYDCPLQTCCSGGGSGSTLEMLDNMKSVAGDFTVLSTGSGGTWLQKSTVATPVYIYGNYFQSGGKIFMTKGAAFTIDLAGNFTLTGGTFVEAERYGMPVLNVHGLFLITGGTFDHSQYRSNLPNEGVGVVNLYGNYLRTGGLQTETATQTGHGEFNFTKSGTQTFVASGGSITNTVNFTVTAGAVVDMTTNILTGDGTFTLQSGGGLVLASPNGITASSASGNIQVTGTRSYSTGGDYTYNASLAQVTGNGLPPTAHNLTFDNASNVTLSGTSWATHLLTLANGKVITGSYEVGTTNTAETSVVNYSDTRYVVGNLRRAMAASGSYDFPVGVMSNYELANITVSGMTGFTSVLGSFTQAYPIEAGYPLVNIFVNYSPITDMLDYGYWTLTPDNPMTGGTYAVTLKERGHTNPDDPVTYAVIKRPGLGSSWISAGTHVNSTQSESGGTATAVRSALAAFSHFGIGKGDGPLPVSWLSFTAKRVNEGVRCAWSTASEVNNSYFSVERSADGSEFAEIGRVNGSGTTAVRHDYSFTDDRPSSGLAYHRVKQNDYDGHASYSDTRSVQLDEAGASPACILQNISPNPFRDRFTMTLDASRVTPLRWRLVSSSGQIAAEETVLMKEGLNAVAFNGGDLLKPGSYTVVLEMNGQVVSKRLLKQ